MRAQEFVKPHQMAKLEKTGRIVEILRHQDQVDFSDEPGWYLINLEPGKRVAPDMKWIPDSTRFEWVREFKRADAVAEDADPAQAWIDKVYAQFPDWPYGQADKVMVWGEGEDQTFAAFKLKPSASPYTVEIDWIMAGPEQRKGVGSRAIKELQRLAQADGIKLTLYPWSKGRISQSSLAKLYKRHGFKPIAKGAKPMTWDPAQAVAEDSFDGIDVTMERDADEITVRAAAGGKQLGHVLFVQDGDALLPQDLEVDERYQGQGIAKVMYDYVKSLGYQIRRSGQQTAAGAGFWGKHRPAQNVWEQDVAEDITPNTIHKLADRTGVKWDNEPNFLQLTKRLTGKEHLDDLNQTELHKVKQHLEKQGVAEG